MEKYLQILKRTKLFHNLTDKETLSALDCLNATVKKYKKGSTLFSEGDDAKFVSVVLSGEIEVRKSDLHGNINIISRLFPCEIIGAVVSFSSDKKLPFDVVCACDTEVIWLDSKKLIAQCAKLCEFHTKIIENAIGLLADKNIQLTGKIDILTKRTIREKLLAYLHAQSKKTKNKRFAIDLSRRQLSEYLSVDRSAMIRELGKMQSENIIGFENNIFWFN